MSVIFIREPIGSSSLDPPVHGGAAKVAEADAWLRRVCRAAGNLVREAIMESRYRSAARQLRMLDNYMLRDIGISRSEIDSIVRHGRAGDRGPF